jgi:hypothetical protein
LYKQLITSWVLPSFREKKSHNNPVLSLSFRNVSFYFGFLFHFRSRSKIQKNATRKPFRLPNPPILALFLLHLISNLALPHFEITPNLSHVSKTKIPQVSSRKEWMYIYNSPICLVPPGKSVSNPASPPNRKCPFCGFSKLAPSVPPNLAKSIRISYIKNQQTVKMGGC